MKKYLLIAFVISSMNSITNAGNPISYQEEQQVKVFCKKISGHANTILGWSFDRKKTNTEISESSYWSVAKPYWSNDTKKWFNIIINEAYKDKWSEKNYKRPITLSSSYSTKDYAASDFEQKMNMKCIQEASFGVTYCSKQAIQDSRNPKNYRTQLYGLCYSNNQVR